MPKLKTNSVKYNNDSSASVLGTTIFSNYINHITDVFCPLLVLESRTTTLFIPGKKYGEEADQQMTISIQTNFWSYVDVGSSPKKHTARDSFLIGQMVKQLTIISGYCYFSLGNNENKQPK